MLPKYGFLWDYPSTIDGGDIDLAKSKKVKEKKEVDENQQIDENKVAEDSDVDSQDIPETASSELVELKATIVSLEEQLAQAKEESETASNDALKYLAELENFKKRKQQEVDSFKKYATESAILEVLSVLDTFELACHIPDEQRENEVLVQFIQGFELILKQFQQTLDRLHVTVVDPFEQLFDPNLHQAVSQEKKDGVAANTVIKVMQRGYKLHDKLIRPAMVVVAE